MAAAIRVLAECATISLNYDWPIEQIVIRECEINGLAIVDGVCYRTGTIALVV
jgi:hypothetical protein